MFWGKRKKKVSQDKNKTVNISSSKVDIRMLFLSLDMAPTASSCVANSTSASPVALPSVPISMCTLIGVSGEKNYKYKKKKRYK